MDYITMHGQALDGSGRLAETPVHKNNVAAFKMAGWKEGGLPEEMKAEVMPVSPVSTTPSRCSFIKKDGQQCGNDAISASSFCHIKAHKS